MRASHSRVLVCDQLPDDRAGCYDRIQRIYPKWLEATGRKDGRDYLLARFDTDHCGKLAIGDLQEFIASMETDLLERGGS